MTGVNTRKYPIVQLKDKITCNANSLICFYLMPFSPCSIKIRVCKVLHVWFRRIFIGVCMYNTREDNTPTLVNSDHHEKRKITKRFDGDY